MREPRFNLSDGSEVTFSAAPSDWLRAAATGTVKRRAESESGIADTGFGRDYAARLLKERGQ